MLRRHGLLLISLLLNGTPVFADCPDRDATTVDGLVRAIDTSQSAVNHLVATDIKKFCGDSISAEVYGAVKKDSGLDVLRKKDLTGIDSWAMSLFPDREIRERAFRENPGLSNAGLNSFEQLESYLKNPHPIQFHDEAYRKLFDQPMLQRIKDLYLNGAYSMEDLEQAKSNFDVKSVIKDTSDWKMREGPCALLDPLAVGCASALKRSMELALPKGAYNYTFLPVFKEVFGNPKYIPGLQQAALKLIQRIKEGNIGNGDLFSDIKQGYIDAGSSGPEAEKMAWNVVGLIGTSGPNLYMRIFYLKTDPKYFPMKIALQALSSLAPVADAMTAGSGHIYSYPPSVRTNCDHGKPYHFWLTAFLARQLVQEGYSRWSAAAGAFTAQKGYEMLSPTSGRDPSKPFSGELFSSYNNTIRMDLAYSSAGAMYGAQSFEEHRITRDFDIDKGLKSIINGSSSVEKMSPEAAKTFAGSPSADFFFAWSRIFNPNAAYNYYVSHGDRPH